MSEAAESVFESFNRMMGMGAVRDPYPRWREMRARGPVHPIDLADWSPPYTPPGEDTSAFVVLSYDGVCNVLRDAATFSSAKYQETADAVMGRNILSMDDPDHARYRALVQQAFTMRALRQWRETAVEPAARALVDALEGRGRTDLVGDFSFVFPVRVIASLFGLPDRDLDEFHRLSVEIQCVLFDFERGVAASRQLTEYFRSVLEEHRRRPHEDLLAGLLEAELDGDRLGDEEIFGFMRLLLPAGLETTYRATSNLLFGLLSHPEQLDAVRRDPSLVDAAVEEALRWEPPMTAGLRFAVRDAVLGGVAIPAGSRVLFSLGSANRDEGRWENPEAFDIFRPQRPNLTFGFGPHKCLGLHLARMEMRMAVEQLVGRLPGLRLDPEAHDVHITGEGFRAPASLPVVFG